MGEAGGYGKPRASRKLRDLLRGKIPGDLLDNVPSSFDIVGSRSGAIAIVEISDNLWPFRELVGRAIMDGHKHVRAVFAKRSPRKGTFRIREYEHVAGEHITEVVHREYGISIKLDILKVYFSPREATERMRVASQVEPGETVMVMFAGVGPYALAIAKVQPLVEKIIAIEINPHAHRYLLENIKLNKLENKITPVLGDVKERASEWYGACDRVVMPLPRGAYLYLDQAIKCLKPEGGIAHFYHWAPEDCLYHGAYMHVERACILHGRRLRIVGLRKVLPYAPRIYKVCVDANIY